MMEIANKSILEIVEENYHTSAVFEKYGIRFYEQPEGEPLRDLCEKQNIDFARLAEEISDIISSRFVPQSLPIQTWKLEFLMDYLKHVHHDYSTMILDQLKSSITFLLEHCTEKKDFMIKLSRAVTALQRSAASHNTHEEEIIFPYIRQLEMLAEKNDGFGHLFVRTLRKPMDALEKGHETTTQMIAGIRELTGDYASSNLSCPKLRVVMRQLKDLELDMMEHKFLENNILFPRAAELESKLLKQHPA